MTEETVHESFERLRPKLEAGIKYLGRTMTDDDLDPKANPWMDKMPDYFVRCPKCDGLYTDPTTGLDYNPSLGFYPTCSNCDGEKYVLSLDIPDATYEALEQARRSGKQGSDVRLECAALHQWTFTIYDWYSREKVIGNGSTPLASITHALQKKDPPGSTAGKEEQDE